MRNYAVIALTLLVSLSSCASLVSTNLDRSANFNQYKTFAFAKPEVKVKSPVYDSKLIDRNIKYAVEQEFARRGIVKDQTQPDLLVKYHTYTEEKEQNYSNFNPYFPYYGYGWGWRMMPFGWGGWGWPSYGSGFDRNYTYTAGTLMLDVIDNRTNELIWRGSIEGDVDNVNRLQKQVEKGVQAIMKKYPLKPNQSPDGVYPEQPLAS